MVYGDLQLFDIIIFAAIAIFLIYRLRNVLGKRTGFQKNLADKDFVEKEAEEPLIKLPILKENEKKLEIVYKKIPSFDHKAFLEGAKKAFEIIITAFNNGDKKSLTSLVSKDVYTAFETAIDTNTNNPNQQFYSLLVEGVKDAKVDNGKVTIALSFLSEQIVDDNEEKIIKNKDTWVFEKLENSKNQIWTLVST